jgi:DNA-binding transcriptional MerR regulator
MAEDEKLKDKLFFSIGEASKLTGVKQYILRYWESEFNLLSPEKTETGQRRYRKKDIDTILKIKDLLYKEGYTIAGAKRQLRKRQLKEEGKLIELEKDFLKRELMDMLKIIGDK